LPSNIFLIAAVEYCDNVSTWFKQIKRETHRLRSLERHLRKYEYVRLDEKNDKS